MSVRHAAKTTFFLLLSIAAAAVICGEATAADAPDHYTLTLENPYDNAQWPYHFHFEYKDGKFGRNWVTGFWRLMGGGQPRLKLDPSGLAIDRSAVKGKLNVQLYAEPQKPRNVVPFSLDLKRDGDRLVGTWTRSFGKPDGRAKIGGAIEGEAGTSGRWALKLNNFIHGFPDDRQYMWLVINHAEGKITESHAEGKRTYNQADHPVDFSGLRLDGNTVTGEAVITLVPDGYVPDDMNPVQCQITLKATVTDGKVSGSYEGVWDVSLQWSGKVHGTVQTEADWTRQNAVSTDGKDWPCWSGPFSNGVGDRYGHQLVDDLADARLAWKSDDMPAGRGSTGTRSRGFPDGGSSSPIVRDGRVYVFYQVPHGGAYHKPSEASAKAAGIEDYDTSQWSITSDEVVHCVDAGTGRTLWKTVLSGKGLFWITSKHTIPNLTPCVFNDRVYAIGTTARVYCLDAKTGRPLWESKIEPLAGSLERFRQESIKAGQFGNRPSMPRVSALSFSKQDDVLITTDFKRSLDFTHGNLGLMAFDGRTGKELWRIPGAIGLWATPVRWAHQGKEYIIAGNTLGQLRCIEPRSGSEFWRVDEVGQFWVEPTVIGDYLIAPVGGLEWSGGYAALGHYARQSGCRVGCYQISSNGARQLWLLPKEIGFPSNDTLVGRDGYAFTRHHGKHVCIDLKTGKYLSVEAADPLASWGRLGPFKVGINELWEDRWVYAPNFTHDRADGTHGMLEARKHHMFMADPKNLRFMNAYLLPHKRFSSYDCKGLTWPYVDGRIFLRGGDGVYCYDLRKTNSGVR